MPGLPYALPSLRRRTRKGLDTIFHVLPPRCCCFSSVRTRSGAGRSVCWDRHDRELTGFTRSPHQWTTTNALMLLWTVARIPLAAAVSLLPLFDGLVGEPVPKVEQNVDSAGRWSSRTDSSTKMDGVSFSQFCAAIVCRSLQLVQKNQSAFLSPTRRTHVSCLQSTVIGYP